MDNHPLFKIDESQFSKEFNLGVVLAKVALGVVSALVVRAALAKIDSFTAKRRK